MISHVRKHKWKLFSITSFLVLSIILSNFYSDKKAEALYSDGTLDTVFYYNITNNGAGTGFNGAVYTTAIAADGSGDIFVGGAFTQFNGINRGKIVRLNANGTIDTDTNFNTSIGTGFNGDVHDIAVQNDQKILVGGAFSTLNTSNTRNKLVRLNNDGTEDTAFYTAFGGTNTTSVIVYTIALQTDQKILIGGTFTQIGGISGRNRIARLTTTGAYDTTFAVGSGISAGTSVRDIRIQYNASEDKVLVGGLFSAFAGVTNRNNLIRLTSTGAYDVTFTIGTGITGGEVRSIDLQSDNKIIVGGAFTTLAGVGTRNKLLRLTENGADDATFYGNMGAGFVSTTIVSTVKVQADDAILVGGTFTYFNGTTNLHGRIVKLNSNGTEDTAFYNNVKSVADNSAFNNEVRHINIQTVSGDDKVLVGGLFTNLNSPYRYYFVRFGTAASTVLGNGSSVTNSTIGPGAVATEIDRFSLNTTVGTDTVTGMTVTLTPVNAFNNIANVDVQTTAGVSKCSLAPTSNTVLLTSCAISVNTTPTDYKILITPKTHANMPAPATPGASYDTGATVTAISATNSVTGTDTSSATVTVDNASPGVVTSSTVTGGNAQVSLAWTNPTDADFTTGGAVVVLRRAGVAVNNFPEEGVSYNVGDVIINSTVACVLAGSPPATSCIDTGLTNGTSYHYKIFTKDSRGNYNIGTVPTGSPVIPANNASITITPSADISITEGVNNPTAYNISLGSAPTANVTITITESSNSINVETPILTFTPANWNTPQSVSVTGSQDANTVSEIDQVVTFDPSSADAGYNALPNQTRNVDVTDNDTPSFVITPVVDLSMTEGATNSTAYQVVLGTEPASNVVIDITESSPQITLNTTSLTFTSGNWNVPQDVSITATEDNSNSINEQDQIVTFAINDAASDNQFDPLVNQTRQIDFIDNDIPSFSITQTSGSTSVIEEGITDSFSVVLGSQPSGNVVIDVTSSDTTALTLSAPEVSFTTVDWNIPKNVTVTGPNDPDTDSENITITASIDQALTLDTNYDTLPAQNFTASVTDNDIPVNVVVYENKFPPVNTNTVTQRKSGSLKVGGFRSQSYVRLDSLVKIPTGAGAGKVLTSDTQGFATWATPSGGNSAGGWTLSGNTVSLTTSSDNISIGSNSIIYKQGNRFIHSNGTGNFFAGINSGSLAVAGTGNTAVGKEALLGLVGTTNGEYNTALGYQALSKGDSWLTGNTAIGSKALGGGVTYGGGVYNTAIGYEALLNTYATAGTGVGSVNTAVGYRALKNNTTGSFNVAVGSGALINNTTGSYNIAIGYGAGPTTGNLFNTVAIGYGATVSQSNKVRIGNTSISTIEFQVAPTVVSDLRLKENINDTDLGLEFIKKLRPVSYTMKQGNGIDYGFIAQEVESAIGKNTNIVLTDNTEFGGKTMRYEGLIAPLVKAVQEQDLQLINDKKELEDFDKRLVELENKLK